MDELESKLRGYLFGSACGDALGMPVEFLRLSMIKSRYGEKGIQDLPPNAPWTDDTQMMLAIARALVRADRNSFEDVMDHIVAEFIKWRKDPGIAPGNTCMRGVYNLLDGKHWSQSGVPNSKGCGSVMRSGIIGYVYRDNTEMLRKVASASGIATHGHPTADAACIAGAYAIKLALENENFTSMYEKIRDFTLGISAEFTRAIDLAFDLASKGGDPEKDLQEIGEGWIAEEAFALSLYCLLRNPDSYVDVVRMGVNITGDSDSVGCIAGGISVAKLGISAVPKAWIDNLEGAHILENICTDLIQI